jgi:uncharacterized protein (DUF427 family)
MARRLDPRPPDELRYLPAERRVRARLRGVDVADSREAVFVWPPRRPVPFYAFPKEAVRADLIPGEAVVRFDDPDLAGLVGLRWEAMDEWFEEDDEVFVHPRDPFHRVEVRQSSRRVRVELEGALLADSSRPLMLIETGLPTRYYLPREDVRLDVLESSPTVTRCPYKGQAEHWARAGTDVAWSYPDPIAEIPQIAGLIAFYNERVDLTVDGERLERPWSPFSPTAPAAPSA